MKDNEAHITRGIREGSEYAFELLFTQYYRPLSVFALKYVGDLETSKEIVQNLFVHLYETRHTLLITNSLESYLYQSVRNRCLNQIKQNQTRKVHLQNYSTEQEVSEDMEARIRETELEHRIFKIVETLPPQGKNVFTLSRAKGLTNNKIAEKLNISRRTVETHISNALKTLRNHLEDFSIK